MSAFKAAAIVFILHCLSASAVALALPYPLAPSPQLTPGELCKTPDYTRYAEKIPYCERDVNTSLKDSIIANYDQFHGFSIRSMDRDMFKIDHYIPLCAGGSNSPKNLWPQHISNFDITDRLERLVCVQMERGRLKQKDAVEIIRRGKNDLKSVPDIMRKLGRL